MKVLLIDVNCKKGSTGKIVYDLYTELNKDGHIASIAYGRGKKISEPNIIKISSDFEVYWHALLARITGLNGCYSYFATRKLIRHIETFKPDIVHLHDPKTYYLNIFQLIKYLKRNRIRTVWTLHSEYMYTGKCGYSYECDKWKVECNKCKQLRAYPKSLLFDFTRYMYNQKKLIFEEFDNLTVVSPSVWLANRAKQSFLGSQKICVIHNGIDTEVFCNRSSEKVRRKHNIIAAKIVLAVAPDIMCERKGGRYVIELAKRMMDESVVFILIGITDLNEKFPSNVIALGRTENSCELAEYYVAADVFVICSKRENFPTTCIESISCGTPVCGFDEGGTKETAPSRYGHFVPYGDIEKLSYAVNAMLFKGTEQQDRLECERYGKENYSKNAMYRRYLELYTS